MYLRYVGGLKQTYYMKLLTFPLLMSKKSSVHESDDYLGMLRVRFGVRQNQNRIELKFIKISRTGTKPNET